MKNCDIFFFFLLKHRLCSNETHNLSLRANIRKKCIPLFYYIKVRCKGVYILRSCFHDALLLTGMALRSSIDLVSMLDVAHPVCEQ